LIFTHDDAGIGASDEVAPIDRVKFDEPGVWLCRATGLNGGHGYLPLNNTAVIAALPQTSRLRGEIPAKAGFMARLFESVTLQSRGIASPFCSNLVALFEGLMPLP
jgi:hypothetical protein